MVKEVKCVDPVVPEPDPCESGGASGGSNQQPGQVLPPPTTAVPVDEGFLEDVVVPSIFQRPLDLFIPAPLSPQNLEILVDSLIPVDNLDKSQVDIAIETAKAKAFALILQYYSATDANFLDEPTKKSFYRSLFTFVDYYADSQLNSVLVLLTAPDAAERISQLPIVPIPQFMPTIDVFLEYRCSVEDFEKQFTLAADVMREYDFIIRRSDFAGTVNNINLVYDAGSLELAGNFILQYLIEQAPGPNGFDASKPNLLRIRMEPQTLRIVAIETYSGPAISSPNTVNEFFVNEILRDSELFSSMGEIYDKIQRGEDVQASEIKEAIGNIGEDVAETATNVAGRLLSEFNEFVENAENKDLVALTEQSLDLLREANKFITNGVNQLDSVLSIRDKMYLMNLYRIGAIDTQSLPWIQFLSLYAPEPKPEILPTSSVADSPFGSFEDDTFKGAFANSLSDKYGGEIGRVTDCFKDQYANFKQAKNDFANIANREKTVDQIIDEKLTFAATSAQQQIIEEAKNIALNTADSQLQEVEEFLERIRTLDDVFKNVLNRISLASLADALVACFPVIDIPCKPLEIPKVPTVGFPDLLPVVDSMSDLSTDIFNAILEALVEAFVSVLSQLINQLLSICDPGIILNPVENPDVANINELINDSERPVTPGTPTGNRKDDIVLATLDAVCKITNRSPGDGLQEYLDQMSELMEDVSLLVPAREVCRLLVGNASQRTLGLILNLVNNKFKLLKECLPDKPTVRNFFFFLGKAIGTDFCEELSALPSSRAQPLITKCDTTEETLEEEFPTLTKLYEQRNVDPALLKELLQSARDRKNKKLKQINDIADIIANNEQGGSVFADIVNQLNKDKGNDGFFSYEHESYDFMQDTLLNTLFLPINPAYNENIEGMVDAMIQNKNVKEDVPVYINVKNEEGEVTQLVSPRLRRLESEGVDIEPILESGKTRIELEETKLEAAPSVKNTLSRLETSDLFVPSLDQEGVYYQLDVPNNPEVTTGIEGLFDRIRSFIDMANIEGSPVPDISLEGIASALPQWKLRYKLPYSTPSSQITQDIKDRYAIEIFSGDSLDNSPESLRAFVVEELSDKASNYIESQIEEQSNPLSVNLAIGNTTRSVYLSEPQSIFGRYVSDRWNKALFSALDQDNIAKYEVASLKKFGSEMSKFFAASVHGQVVKDLFSLISGEVARSELFESKEQSVGVGDVVVRSSTPNLSNLDFNPPPTDLEIACGIFRKPSKIDCFRKEVKENIAQNSGEISNPDTCNEEIGMDPWDKTVIQTVVKMTVRAYAYDYAMRVIFLIPSFTIEDSVDSYVVEFLFKKMTEEMKLYDEDGTYLNNFKYWAYVTYTQDIGVEAKDRTEVTEEDSSEAIKYFLTKSFESVSSDIRNAVEQSFPETTTGHKTPKQYLIEDWIPAIDLPTSVDPWSSRFTTLDGGILNDAGDGLVELNGRRFNLDNGNFFLERYIKIVRKDFVDIEETLKENVPPSANPDIEALVQIVKNSWKQNFTDRPGEKINYMNVSNFAEAFEKFKSDVGTQAQNGLSKVSSDFWNICNFFEEVTPGMRLIYLLPTKTGNALSAGFAVQNIDFKFGTSVPSYEQYYGGQSYFSDAINSLKQADTTVGQGGDKINDALTTLRFREKAYSILEERFPEGDPTQLIQEESPGVVREIYPIPLIDTAICVGDSQWWEENRTNSIFEFSPNPQNSKFWWRVEYDKNEQRLKEEIQNSQEYSVLFDYIFPLDRYLSIITTYTFMSVSSLPNVESSFSGVKSELYSLFTMISLSLNTLNVSTGYQFQEFPSNEDIAEFFNKAKFGFQSPCFSFAFSPVPPNLNGFGLDLALKLAIKTPLLIFKGFVEVADPNIKIAKFIVDLLKAIGVCIPIPFISLGLLPPTVFGFPPIGIGIGPPLTPYGFGYLALGFESFFTDLFVTSSGEGEQSEVLPEACDEICPDKTY